MDQAGILEVNQRAYLGHGPKTITDLYRWHDVVRFLDGDAEKLVGFLVGSLGEEPTQVLMSRPGIEPGACRLKARTWRDNRGHCFPILSTNIAA